MLKFKNFQINEDYSAQYHSKIDVGYIEDVYQYLFDIGFRLDEYEHDDDDDDDTEKYGKSDFSKYIMSHGEYGFKTTKGKNITDNIQAGSLPALRIKFSKKLQIGGSNTNAIKSFNDVSEIYKEISGIISKLNKKSIDVDIKQTLNNGLIAFEFIIMDRDGKVKSGELNFRITKLWKDLTYSVSVSDENDYEEDVEFDKDDIVGQFKLDVHDDEYETVNRQFTDAEFELFKEKIKDDDHHRKGLDKLCTKHKLSYTITPGADRKTVIITFADAVPTTVVGKKAVKKTSRRKKQYSDSNGTILEIGDSVKFEDYNEDGDEVDVIGTVLSFRGNNAKIEIESGNGSESYEEGDEVNYSLNFLTKVIE